MSGNSWAGKHKKELAIAAAIAGAAVGGPAVLGMMAPEAAAAGAAGAGAAEGLGATGAVAGDAFMPGLLGAGGEGMGAAIPGASGMTELAGASGLPFASTPSFSTLSAGSPTGMASIFGPSDFTAAQAGDAYLPGALGPGGGGSASLGSQTGGLLSNLGGGMSKASKAYQLAQSAGAFGPQGGGQQMPQAQPAPPPRTPQAGPSDISQEILALYGRRKWLDDLLNPENPLGGPRYG